MQLNHASSAQLIPRSWYWSRLIPRWLPGRTRLTRAFFRFLVRSMAHAKLFEIHTGFLIFYAPSLQEPVATSLILDGDYEPGLRLLLRRTLKNGAVFVDAGANIGCHSYYASRYLDELGGGDVVSIEASPRIFQLLQRGINANRLGNIQAFNILLGDTEQNEASFYEAPDRKFGMGSRSSERFRGFAKNVLQMKKLDTVISDLDLHRIDVIKIDVEGYESSVLEGARVALQTYHPIIVFEFCDWSENRPHDCVYPGEAQRLLMAMGYKIYTLKTWLDHGQPLASPLTTGSADLVAEWPSSSK